MMMCVFYVIPKVLSVKCWQFTFFTIFSDPQLAIPTSADFASCRTRDNAAAGLCKSYEMTRPRFAIEID